MPDYSFVISNKFKPFTLQEMLVPMQAYKTAYDEMEKNYNELSDKTDAFKYLSETLPEGSKARQLYEGYAKEVEEGAKSLSEGLTMSNRRTYSQLRKRYMGEIGRLEKADTALQKEIERRTTLNSTDPTTLYATDNISIDDFLDRKRPNSYSVSGQKLYERGVQIGTSNSSRIWGNPQAQDVNTYYQNLYTTSGRDPRVLAAWRRDLASIPELNESLESTLKEYGVTDNLTGVNYERAKESVINGIINGSIYKRNDNIQKNLGVLTAAENADLELKKKSLNQSARELALKETAATQDEWMYTHAEDGKTRTGLSDAGKAYLSMTKSSKTSTTEPDNSPDNNGKDTHTLRKGEYIKNGKVYKQGSGTPAGEEISYDDAVNIDPSVAQYDPSYEQHYRWYKDGNGNVYPVPKYSTVKTNGTADNSGNSTSITGNSSAGSTTKKNIKK